MPLTVKDKLARYRKPDTRKLMDVERSGVRVVQANSVAIDTISPTQFRTYLTNAEAGDIAAQAELFEKMEERDIVLDSHLRTRRRGVLACEWEIQPGEDSAQAVRIADEAQGMFDAIPGLDVALEHSLSAVGMGFAVLEILWDMSARQWQVVGLDDIPQRWFTVNEDGDELRIRDNTQYGAEMPSLNFCEFRSRARSGFLARTALLRSCVRPYIIRQYGWRDWVRLNELVGTPTRIGRLREGVGLDEDEAQELYRAVQAIGHDFAAVLRAGNDIEFVSPSGVSVHSDMYAELIKLARLEMTLGILGQTLTSGGEEGGSYALGEVHEHVRWDLVDSDAAGVSGAWDREILQPWCALNHGPDAPAPQMVIHCQQPEDQRAIAESIARALNDIGLPISTDWVYERLHIPKPGDADPVLVRMPEAAGAEAANETSSNGVGTVVANQVEGPASDRDSFAIPPQEAMDWWAEKRVVTADEAEGLSPAMRQRAFWITGVDDPDLLLSVGRLVGMGLASGWTQARFREAVRELGVVPKPDEAPGPNQIPAGQANLVFRQNTFAALAAGRYIQMARSADTRPGWQYLTAGDEAVRPAHRALDKVIKPLADPFWDKHYPPWEWACRCTVVSLSLDEMEAEGLAYADDAELAARWESAQHTTFPAEFEERFQEITPLYRERARRGEKLQLPPSNPKWEFSRRDAFFLEAEGGAPITDRAQTEWAALVERPAIGTVEKETAE